jgi:predicted phosphoribosyltransferase
LQELDRSLDAVEAFADESARAVERRARAYRGERPPADLAGRTVILVDAVVTGDRIRAPVRAPRQRHAIPHWCVGSVSVADLVDLAQADGANEVQAVQVLHNPVHRGIEWDLMR